MRKPKKTILISGPSITDKEVNYVAEATTQGWGQNANKYVAEFEKKFAEYIGVKYAIATSSCTGAIHLAVATLEIKKGDEVIAPEITWIGTVAPVYYVGAKVVFTDIDSETWCIDAEKIEEKINKRTRAIIPVHLYGHPAEMDRIKTIAKKHNLSIIEDAAQAIGAKYEGSKIGSFGDFACFSFNGAKILVTGEGGMLTTNNYKLFKRAQFLSNQGRHPKKTFWNTNIAYKYKMSNMQAALGTVQLSRINKILQKKKIIFQWYQKRLKKIPGIQLNTEKPNCVNTYWMVTVILDKKFKINKRQLMHRFLSYNIASRPFFYPLSSMPPFRKNTKNPISYSIHDYGINLPCGYNITENEVKYICNALLKIIGNRK